METDPVILKLIADVRDYNANVANARRLTDERLNAIEKRGFQMGQGINKAFSMATRAAVTFAAGFITLDLARNFLAIADEAKNLDAQLRLATSGFGSFGQATDDVRRIAAETRSGLTETAALYGNLARTGKELGLSQTEVARASETVAKTFKISGASTVEAAQSTRQLIQALQSGVLRGDEFNSIMEASPRLARLLADSLDVPVGSLRAMAEAGTLTADKLARAFTDKRFTDGIDAEFRELPVTFSEAMGQVENAAIITFGAFDRGGQFSSALASFVTDGANGFADLESAATSFGRNARSELDGLAAAFGPVIAEAQRLIGIMAGQDWSKAFSLRQDMKDIDQFTGWLSQQGLGGALLTGNSVKDWQSGKPSGTNFTQRYDEAKSNSDFSLRARAGEQWANDALKGYDRFMNPIAPAPRSRPATGAAGGSTRKRSGPSAESLAAKAERERLQAVREESGRERDKARLDDELIAAKSALATASQDILTFELQQIERRKTADIADVDTSVMLGQLGEEEAVKRREVIAEIAQQRILLATRNKDEADRANREDQLRDDADTLQAQERASTNRRDRAEIEKRILDLQHQIERSRLEEAVAAGKVADVTKARANLEARQSADVAVLARESAGPLDQYRERLRQSGENINDEVESYVVQELDHVRDGIRGALEKVIGTDDPLISGLLNLLIEQVIMKPLAEALSKSSGGGFGAGGVVKSLFGSIFGRASGGSVNAGQMYRVNEGASPGRVEGFIPQGAGHIVPLGKMNAMVGGRSSPRVFNISVDARNSVTPEGFAQELSSLVLRQAAAMDAQASMTTLRAVPGRFDQYGRDGT